MRSVKQHRETVSALFYVFKNYSIFLFFFRTNTSATADAAIAARYISVPVLSDVSGTDGVDGADGVVGVVAPLLPPSSSFSLSSS